MDDVNDDTLYKLRPNRVFQFSLESRLWLIQAEVSQDILLHITYIHKILSFILYKLSNYHFSSMTGTYIHFQDRSQDALHRPFNFCCDPCPVYGNTL